MRSPVRSASLALVAVTALAAAGCASGPKEDAAAGSSSGGGAASASTDCEQTETLTINLALASPAGLLRLGEDAGIFAEHCLVLETTYASAPPQAVSALIGGSADISFLPAVGVVSGLSNGLPLQVFAPINAVPEDAAGRPEEEVDESGVYAADGVDISSPRDLEGKTVAIPGRGGQLELGISKAVEEDGGDPSAINYVQLDQPTAVTQLAAGQLDAAVLSAPFSTQVQQEGTPRVPGSSPVLAFYAPGDTYVMWVTTPTVLDARADAIEAFYDAILELNAYANENADEFIQALSEVTEIPADVASAGAEFAFGDSIDEGVLTDVADTMADLGFIPSAPDLDDVVVTFG